MNTHLIHSMITPTFPDGRIVAVFILTLVAFKAVPGQNNADSVEWAPIGAKWWYNYGVGVTIRSEGTLVMESVGDTVIRSKRCRILTNEGRIGDHIDQLESYYIHQNGDSILYYNAELDTFVLLYDFSSTAEDTVFLLEPHSFYGDSLIPLSVNNRKWIDSLGLRTFDYTYLTEHTQQTLWLFSGHVIEKIGNVGQYFFPIIGNWCDAGCGEGLRCYQDEHLSVNLVSGEPCEVITSVFSHTYDSPSIYPNPASTYVDIQDLQNKITRAMIYNSQGQIVHDSPPGRIDIAHLPPGFYTVLLLSRQQFQLKKLVKK